MVEREDFQTAARTLDEKRRVSELEDWQNETADRENGRQKRTFARESGNGQSAREKHDRAMSALQFMLQNDPEYAALYHETDDLLRRAETATEKALQEAERESIRQADALTDMREKANKLPNGAAVFRDKDGNVRAEDGRLLEAAEAESVVLKNGAPSYEDYLRQREETEGSRKRIDDLRRYQVEVLGNARNRMADEDNPLSREELGTLQEDIYRYADPVVKKELRPESISEADKIAAVPIAKPTL